MLRSSTQHKPVDTVIRTGVKSSLRMGKNKVDKLQFLPVNLFGSVMGIDPANSLMVQ